MVDGSEPPEHLCTGNDRVVVEDRSESLADEDALLSVLRTQPCQHNAPESATEWCQLVGRYGAQPVSVLTAKMMEDGEDGSVLYAQVGLDARLDDTARSRAVGQLLRHLALTLVSTCECHARVLLSGFVIMEYIPGSEARLFLECSNLSETTAAIAAWIMGEVSSPSAPAPKRVGTDATASSTVDAVDSSDIKDKLVTVLKARMTESGTGTLLLTPPLAIANTACTRTAVGGGGGGGGGGGFSARRLEIR